MYAQHAESRRGWLTLMDLGRNINQSGGGGGEVAYLALFDTVFEPF